MGQTADQLRQEIEQKRGDAAQKIDAIESRVQDTTQMVKSTVEDTKQMVTGTVKDTVQETTEKVKQSADLGKQIEERPLVVLGAALAGGFLLGGIMGGNKGGHSGGGQSAGMSQGGMSSGLRGAVKSSGLEDELAAISGTLMGMITERVRSTVQESFPGFAERMTQHTEQTRQQSGSLGAGRGMALQSGSSTSTSSSSLPAVTDASGRTAPYFSDQPGQAGSSGGSSIRG